jgi:hypothetical protein
MLWYSTPPRLAMISPAPSLINHYNGSHALFLLAYCLAAFRSCVSGDGSNGINIRKDKQAEGVREIEPRQRQEGNREDEGGERQSKQTDRSLSKRGIQKRGREPKRRDRSDQARFWR